MNFIQKLVNKYDLNEHEVTTEYAQHLIEEKSLPKEIKINLETVGLSLMDERADELQTTMREAVSQKESQEAPTLSRGAMMAKEQNEAQAKEASNQIWGME